MQGTCCHRDTNAAFAAADETETMYAPPQKPGAGPRPKPSPPVVGARAPKPAGRCAEATDEDDDEAFAMSVASDDRLPSREGQHLDDGKECIDLFGESGEAAGKGLAARVRDVNFLHVARPGVDEPMEAESLSVSQHIDPCA